MGVRGFVAVHDRAVGCLESVYSKLPCAVRQVGAIERILHFGSLGERGDGKGARVRGEIAWRESRVEAQAGRI